MSNKGSVTDVGNIASQVLEDEDTIRLLLEAIRNRQQSYFQEICQEGIYQVEDDGSTTLIGNIKK